MFCYIKPTQDLIFNFELDQSSANPQTQTWGIFHALLITSYVHVQLASLYIIRANMNEANTRHHQLIFLFYQKLIGKK